jgi:hypothetical protein
MVNHLQLILASPEAMVEQVFNSDHAMVNLKKEFQIGE